MNLQKNNYVYVIKFKNVFLRNFRDYIALDCIARLP